MGEVPGAGPAVGQVSADGMFRWNGSAWVPVGAGEREPTAWTRPMQLAAAAYLLISTLLSIAFTFAFINRESLLRAIQSQPSNRGLPPEQLDQAVGIAVASAIGGAVFFGLIYLFLALGSFLGWTWVFYADLVIFGLATIGEVVSLISIANPSAQAEPFWALLVTAVVGLAGPVLFVWLLIGLIRYGPWAKARPGRA